MEEQLLEELETKRRLQEEEESRKMVSFSFDIERFFHSVPKPAVSFMSGHVALQVASLFHCLSIGLLYKQRVATLWLVLCGLLTFHFCMHL